MFNPFFKFNKYFFKNGYLIKSSNIFLILFTFFKSFFFFKINTIKLFKQKCIEFIIKALKKISKKKYKKKNINLKKIFKMNFFKYYYLKNYYLSFLFHKIKKRFYNYHLLFIYLNPLYFFFKIVEKIKPILNIFTKTIFRKVQKIPIIIKNYEALMICFQWIRNLLNNNNNILKFSLFFNNLCFEFLLIFFNKSSLLKTKKEFYKLILKNRTLLRFLK